MKILPVRAELFPEDRETDMKKLIVAFCKSVNTPKTNIQNSAQQRVIKQVSKECQYHKR
jgi:hypothetical protein